MIEWVLDEDVGILGLGNCLVRCSCWLMLKMIMLSLVSVMSFLVMVMIVCGCVLKSGVSRWLVEMLIIVRVMLVS